VIKPLLIKQNLAKDVTKIEKETSPQLNKRDTDLELTCPQPDMKTQLHYLKTPQLHVHVLKKTLLLPCPVIYLKNSKIIIPITTSIVNLV